MLMYYLGKRAQSLLQHNKKYSLEVSALMHLVCIIADTKGQVVNQKYQKPMVGMTEKRTPTFGGGLSWS